jgi:hypothetical protein
VKVSRHTALVSGHVTVGFGDVVEPGRVEQADRDVAQGGHDLGRVAGADLGAVLVVGHVAHVVQPVLDIPVLPHPGGESQRVGGAGLGGGDEVDDLDALAQG